MGRFKKIIGWLLLLAGLGLIFWTLYSSYNIFNGRAKAPEIFKMEIEAIKTPATKGKIPTSPAELQKEMEKMIEEQLKGLLPLDFLPKLLNLISWSIFAGILILGGGKISSLGIKLIKK